MGLKKIFLLTILYYFVIAIALSEEVRMIKHIIILILIR